MRKRIQQKIMAVSFLIILFCFGFISDYKVMNFYINDVIDYNEWKTSVNSKFETDYISNFWKKIQYVNLNGLMRNILGQQEMNDVVKMNNGALTKIYALEDKERINRWADQTKKFKESLEEKEIEYLYVTLPYSIDKYNEQLPRGIEDYGNVLLDDLDHAMSDRGIQTLDLRECLHDEGLETYDIFYKTDHHWNTEGGFWAASELVTYLESTYGFEADEKIRNLENYSITTYKNWHLGSFGQRTGIFYAGIDDYDLILPEFDTYIEIYDSNAGGTMEEMMIDRTALQNREYTSRYTYDFVMNSIDKNWHNPNASVDRSVLVVGDSMSRVVLPYFALTFKDVFYVYDMEVNKITEEYIETYKPDMVISMYYINGVRDEGFDWQY